MKTKKFPSHLFVLFACVLTTVTISAMSDSKAYSSTNLPDHPHADRQLILMLDKETDADTINHLIHTYCPGALILEQIDTYALIELNNQSDLFQTAKDLCSSPSVISAEPNYYIEPMQLSKDTYTGSQWSLENTGHYRSFLTTTVKKRKSIKGIDLNIKPAWSVYNKKSSAKYPVIVAAIDTGVDVTHDDLVDNIWINPGEIPDDGIDNDDNGYIDDINGWDFYNNDNSLCSYLYDHSTNTFGSDPADNDDHGTHVAGIIGAVANNHIGIAGAASNVDIKLMPLKIEGGAKGNGTISSAVKAIKYAEKMGAKVCNISWGSGLNSAALAQAIKESSMLFVTAAGNAGTNNDKKPVYPASYNLDNIISVTFITADGKLSALSNYGKNSVDIAAPGYDILSTTVGSSYGSMSGSSMAVPHVSALAAMVYASQNHLYASQVKELILDNITSLTSLKGKVRYPGLPDTEKLVYAIHQLKPDTIAPTISCSTSYKKNSIQIKLETKDTGGSGIRVVKYLYGRHSLDEFEHGTVGTTITGNRLAVQKQGTYTFYISDYAGNEQRKVYEVKEDKTPPVIRTSYSSPANSRLISVTCLIQDHSSGVKEVRFVRGKKSLKDFNSADTGKPLESDDDGYYHFYTSFPGAFTIYAVDNRGNKTVHNIRVHY